MQKGEVFAQKRPKLRLDEPLVSSAVCRPVLTVSFLFLLCSAILFFFDVETRLLAALFALILCGAFWLLTRGRDVGDLRLFSVLVSCALLLVLLSETGVCLWQSRAKEVREELLRDGSTTAVTAEVCGVEEGRALLRVVRAEPISLEEYAVCDAAELSEGERVTGKAVLFLLETRTENKTLRLLGHDVSLGLAWEETPVCSGGAPLLSSFGERISDLLSEAKSASFLRAILLADKSGVSASFSRALSAVGASHLLALSGLHLGILMYSLYRIFSLLFFGRRCALTVGLLTGGVFLLLCGVPLSLLRAYVMFALAFLAELLRLRQSSVQSLFLAAALIVFFDRSALSDVGFLLSVTATLGILLFVPMWEESFDASRVARCLSGRGVLARLLLRLLRAVLLLVVTSGAALTFTLPVAALSFGTVSPLAPLFGIILIPLFTLLLNFAFAFLLVSLFSLPVLTNALAFLCDVLCRLFVFSVEGCAKLSFEVEFSSSAALFATAVTLLFLIYCLCCRVSAARCALALPLFLASAMLFTFVLSCFAPQPPYVRLVGEDEAVYLLADDGQRRVCLVSPSPKSDVKRVGEASFGEVTDLVLLPGSHAIADDACALASRVSTARLWLPAVGEEEEKVLEFVLLDWDGELCFYERGESLPLEGIFAVCQTDGTGVTVSLSLDSGPVHFSRTGGECRLFASPDLDEEETCELLFSSADEASEEFDAVVRLSQNGA